MNKKSKGYITGIVVTIIAVSLVVYQLKTKYNFGNSKEEIQIQSFDSEKNSTDKVKLSDEEKEILETMSIGAEVIENFDYPDKEKIHFKILNAMDNFKTAKGEFIEEIPRLNSYKKSQFEVDNENKSSMYVFSENGEASSTLIYHDDKRKVFDDRDNSYREFEEKQVREKPMLVNPTEVFINGDLDRKDRGYLLGDIIASNTFRTLLIIYKDWNYTESSFLGRDAYKIEGTISPKLSQADQGKFSLLVDKETGIVLQFLNFDENNNVKSRLECTKLELNMPIDENIYNKDTSGYMKK